MTNIRKISPELADKARVELNEVEKRIPEDIAVLREWIKKQPHLNSRTDDQFLLTFLRGCKYNLDKAKQKIDYYHTIKTLDPDLFLDSKITKKSMKLAKIGPVVQLLKPLKPDGPSIVLTRYEGVDNDEVSFIDIFKNQLKFFTIQMLENDNSVISGVLNIVDFAHVSMGFLIKFNPVLGHKMAVFLDNALPLQVVAMHAINFPKEGLTILKTIQSLMPQKLRDKMKVHSSLESLYEYVPKEYLPQEYGGNNGRINDSVEKMEKLLLKYKTYFEEDDQYKTNETLRVGPKVTYETMFGLEKSFQKLEID